MGRKYTKFGYETRSKVVAMVLAARGDVQAVSKEVGIPRVTVETWHLKYLAHGDQGLRDKPARKAVAAPKQRVTMAQLEERLLRLEAKYGAA